MLIAFYLLSGIAVISGILPQIRRDHWTFRVFEFPRLQKLGLGVFCLILGGLVFYQSALVIILMLALVVLVVYQLTQILPFTPLGRKTLATSRKPASTIKLLIANVYQPNDKFHKLNQLIEAEEPDIILTLETDRHWQEGLKPATHKYPYRLEKPLDNTYGMLLYSQLKITGPKIRYLVDKEMPSFKCKLSLNEQEEVLFYALHPPPPSPTENAYSTARDRELLMVADEIEGLDQPVIVAGDLNDVAWSFTTDEFLKISKLKDPRRGRGVYSSYNANNILFRWPLDHLFCSKHFKLKRLKRLRHIGSDHFPILVELSY